MRLGWAALSAALVAGCGFAGSGATPKPDADPARPDADRLRPDADIRIPDAAPDDPDATPPPVCPDNYGDLGGPTRYRFVSTQASWIDAETDCDDDSNGPLQAATHLVVLDNGFERAGLALLSNDQWMGSTDLANEGDFAWVTDQADTESGLASGQAANHDCVRLKNTGAFEIRDCDETNVYFCECDGLEPDPARFPNPPDGNGN